MSIKIDLSGLENSVSNLEKKAKGLEDLNNRLDSLIGQMDASWEGNANERYIKKLRGYETQAKKIVDVVMTFASYASKALELFDGLDSKSAQKIRNIS